MAERPRICLIDDDPMVRDALALGLDDAGFHVVTAGDAKAGLALLAGGGFDAVISDMNMPAFGGAEVIPAICTAHPALPVIAISGASQIAGRHLQDLARDLGATACLLKPFRARELTALLTKLLQERG